jgi:hypothetical protein
MKVAGQFQASAALLLRKVASVPIGQETGWAPESQGALERRKSLALAEIRTPAVYPVELH